MPNQPKLPSLSALPIINTPCPEWPPAKEPESLLAKILKTISGPMEG